MAYHDTTLSYHHTRPLPKESKSDRSRRFKWHTTFIPPYQTSAKRIKKITNTGMIQVNMEHCRRHRAALACGRRLRLVRARAVGSAVVGEWQTGGHAQQNVQQTPYISGVGIINGGESLLRARVMARVRREDLPAPRSLQARGQLAQSTPVVIVESLKKVQTRRIFLSISRCFFLVRYRKKIPIDESRQTPPRPSDQRPRRRARERCSLRGLSATTSPHGSR